MTLTEIKISTYDSILSVIRSIATTDDFRALDRRQIALTARVHDHYVSKAILLLTNKQALIKGPKINNVTRYKLSTYFDSVTGNTLTEWVTEYTTNVNAAHDQKKAQLLEKQSELTLALNHESTPLARARENFQNAMQQYSNEHPYGFFGLNGPEWFTTADEAAQKAKEVMLIEEVGQVFIVQKIGSVHNVPTATFY